MRDEMKLRVSTRGSTMVHRMNSSSVLVSYFMRLAALWCLLAAIGESTYGQFMLMKTETFDADPGWDQRNNRATDPGPRQIVQNFGYAASSSNAGGAAGEIGGFI